MINNKPHIVSKIVALILLFAVATPTVVKFAHIFEDHKHEVCTNTSSSHLHEIEYECELFKFKTNSNLYLIISDFDVFDNTFVLKSKVYNYNFLTYHQQDSTFLRGPPNC